MRPYPEEILRAIQTGVVSHLAPELQSNYGRAQFAFGMMLFGIALRDYDTAVPDLLESNRVLRSMLQDVSTALASVDRPDARPARDTLEGLAPPSDSLKLSALRAEHDALRGAVASLATLIEPAEDDPALARLRPVRKALFDWLKADAKRREVPILSA
jgi:hypothetical protein